MLDHLKLPSIQLAQHFALSGDQQLIHRAERLLNCAPFIRVAVEKGTLQQHIQEIWWCKQRCCPICAYGRSRKIRAKLFQGLPRLLAENPGKFLFLTVTVRNCHIKDLASTLEGMERGWRRMTHRESWPALGYLKVTEVTVPYDCFWGGIYLGRWGIKSIERWKRAAKILEIWDLDKWQQFSCEECHPHFHALLFVGTDYESGSASYLDHLSWVALWKMSMRLPYTPVVDIRHVQRQGQALLEMSKYVVKPADLVSDCFRACAFARVLHGVRLISSAGLVGDYISQKTLDRISEEMVVGDEQAQAGVSMTYTWHDSAQEYEITQLMGRCL